jgi:hypothetical protein
MLNSNKLYGIIFRKTEHFITTDARTLNTRANYLLYLFDHFYASNTGKLMFHIKFAATIN